MFRRVSGLAHQGLGVGGWRPDGIAAIPKGLRPVPNAEIEKHSVPAGGATREAAGGLPLLAPPGR